MNDNGIDHRLDAVADLLIRAWHLIDGQQQLAVLRYMIEMALHETATQTSDVTTGHFPVGQADPSKPIGPHPS